MNIPWSVTANRFYYKIFLSLFILITVGAILGVIYFTMYSKLYVPPSADSSVVIGVPEIDKDKYGYSVINVGEEFEVKVCGEPNIDGKNVECYLTNPEKNNVLIKGVINNQDDQILGESGIISPGEYVKSIILRDSLPKGEHPVTIKILSFEPETYYSMGVANLKTTFKVS